MTDIKRTYLNGRVAGAFQGVSGFLRNRKKWKNKDEVERELRKLQGYAVHKEIRRKFPRRAIKVLFQYDVLAADLKDIASIAKYNNNNRFILFAIDGFSKKGFARMIKDKTGKSVVRALASIFREMGTPPRLMYCDQGVEFHNQVVKSFLKTKGCRLYNIYSHIKSSFSERFIRTIYTRIQRYMTERNNLRIVDILPQLVAGYNNSIHSTIKTSPNQVTPENEMQIFHDIYLKRFQEKPKGKPKYHVNDLVRISVEKAKFSKGYNPNFSTEVFRIAEVRSTNPYTYHLTDLNNEKLVGQFYEPELDMAVLLEQKE